MLLKLARTFSLCRVRRCFCVGLAVHASGLDELDEPKTEPEEKKWCCPYTRNITNREQNWPNRLSIALIWKCRRSGHFISIYFYFLILCFIVEAIHSATRRDKQRDDTTTRSHLTVYSICWTGAGTKCILYIYAIYLFK